MTKLSIAKQIQILNKRELGPDTHEDFSKSVYRKQGELLRVAEDYEGDLLAGVIVRVRKSSLPDRDGEYYVDYVTESGGVDTAYVHYNVVESFCPKAAVAKAMVLLPKRRKLNLTD